MATPLYLLRGSGSTGNVYQIRKDIEDIVIAKCPALQNFRRQQPNTRILFKVMENKDAYTEYNEYTKALAGVYDPSYGVSLIICICNATDLINTLALDPATHKALDPATHKALILVDSGMSLYDYLNTNQNQYSLTLAQLRYLISQFHRIIAVLTSLQHNDIKIQNIVVQINAENKATPFIIDFGLTGDIQDNFLGSLSYPAWSLEIGAFILRTAKDPLSATNEKRMEWFINLPTDSIRPYLFKETHRDSWVQFLIDNKIIVSSSGIVLSNNSVEIRNYLIDQMKEGMCTEIEESDKKGEDFKTFRTRLFHKSDVFSLGIIFMQIYNANKNNTEQGVQGYLERFKSMFLPMLYANVSLRPNWRQVESEFASTVSVTAQERRRQRKRSRCRTRKTRR